MKLTRLLLVVIDRLQSKFKLTNLMLIYTGNGRHILVPFIFERPFEDVKEMQPLVNMSMSAYRQTSNNIISENFLSFAKKYLQTITLIRLIILNFLICFLEFQVH